MCLHMSGERVCKGPCPAHAWWCPTRRFWQRPAAQMSIGPMDKLRPGVQREWGLERRGSSFKGPPKPTSSPAWLVPVTSAGRGGARSPSRRFSPALKCHDQRKRGMLISKSTLASWLVHSESGPCPSSVRTSARPSLCLRLP